MELENKQKYWTPKQSLDQRMFLMVRITAQGRYNKQKCSVHQGKDILVY